jgi:hypothetical protein
MRLLILSALALLALGSCIDTPNADQGNVPQADTNWMGEVRMTKGDTVIRICGNGKTYRLSGPDMDTLAFRYVHARMNTGQWMKVWCYGHLGTISIGGLMDSALFAVKFQHLDASLHCDPVPDERVSGDWKLDDMDTLHPRAIHLHLFGDGTATMITQLAQGQPALEEEGTWGMDVENRVNVLWPQRQQTMLFTWDGTTLINTNGVPGKSITMRKQGHADRMAGAFGRTARWLATTATTQGKPTRAEDLLPSTPLAELFPTPAALQALRTQALDTLDMDTESAALRLDAAATVHDCVLMMRSVARR